MMRLSYDVQWTHASLPFMSRFRYFSLIFPLFTSPHSILLAAMPTPSMLVALGFMTLAATGLIVATARRVKQAKRKEIDFLISRGRREEPKEFFGADQAWKFPVTGSCVLGGLYLVIKYLPKWVIAYALSTYLVVISVTGVAGFMKPFLQGGRLNVATGTLSWLVGGAYLYTKHWVLNNVLAASISITAMEAIPLKTFQTSAMLLSGLFFYDIFWVFGTDVMVTVAKNIEGPIKILFPQDILGDHEKKSLLGLGDIVIPGFFIMQLLRLDMLLAARHRLRSTSAAAGAVAGKAAVSILAAANPTKSRYFTVAMVAYTLSLLNTMAVMVIFEAAQPALLYIVPYLLLSAMGYAAYRGELKMLWNYCEDTADLELADLAPSPDAKTEVDAAAAVPVAPAWYVQVADVLLMPFGLDSEARAEAKEKTA